MIKVTHRQFVFSVPVGTEMTMIRTYTRAVDGTDYPVDREIEVPVYEQRTVKYVCRDDTERTCENTTEQWALIQEKPGTLAVSCIDTVEFVEA